MGFLKVTATSRKQKKPLKAAFSILGG